MKLAGRVFNRSKDLLFVPALEGLWRARLRGKIICYLYHRVDNPASNNFLTKGGLPVISPDSFRREMQFLASSGSMFLTFRELAEGRFPRENECGVIVCFDDCFRDNYAVGCPILEEFSIRATFFQTTAMIGAGSLLWEHALYWHTRSNSAAARFASMARETLRNDSDFESSDASDLIVRLRERVSHAACDALLKRAATADGENYEMAAVARHLYPTAEDVRRAHQRGHEIGSHGDHHFRRESIDAVTFERELGTSMERLRDLLGKEPVSFSYPFNSYFPGDDRICRKYTRVAATVDKRLIEKGVDLMWVPRFTWPGSGGGRLRQKRWLLTGTV